MNQNISQNVFRPNKIPFNTIFLLLFSLIISFLAYLNPLLYELFYEKVIPELNWSWLTSYFLHGTGSLKSMVGHLFGNIILGTLIFGYLIENILGTGRAFYYSFFSIIFTLIYFNISGHYGHGASSITYSFFAFGIFICYEYIKRQKWKSLMAPLFWLFFLITAYSIVGNIGLYISNVNTGGRNVHTISFVIGIVLSYIWRNDIGDFFDLNYPKKYRYTSIDKIAIIMLLAMSSYNIYGIISTGRELEKRQILKSITKDIGISRNRDELNNNSGQIVIRFEKEMLPIIHSYGTSISVNNLDIPKFKWKWLDTKTLYVKIYSALGRDVNKYQVTFPDLKTIDKESINQDVEISLE